MPLVLLLILFVLAVIALIPLSLIQRYRVGTSRQRARGWLATLNLVALTLSAITFLFGAAMTSFWIPHAFTYTAAGLGMGCLLGIVGLWLTRWEPSADALHYTPNRWLALAITLVVAVRVAYGFWRAWQSWDAGMSGGSWYVAAGVEKMMAAGGVVLGYYLAFWIGVRRRLRQRLMPVRRRTF